MTFLSSCPRHKRLFLKCVAISCALHLVGLIYFYMYPILIHSSRQSLFGISSAEPDLLEYDDAELAQKNALIEEAFHHIVIPSPELQHPLDLIELPKGMALSPNIEESALEEVHVQSEINWEGKSSSSEPIAIQEEPIFHEDSLIKSLFVPQESNWNFATQIQIDHEATTSDISGLESPEDWLTTDSDTAHDLVRVSEISCEASPETDCTGVNLSDKLPQAEIAASDKLSFNTGAGSMLSKIKPVLIPEEKSSTTHSYLLAPKTLKFPKMRSNLGQAHPDLYLENYDLPSLALASSWNDACQVDLKFIPNEEGKGYIFSLSLRPDANLNQYSLKQNIHFIIDRSNSVQKHRFSVFKRAVMKALSCMQQCDAFNIYLIDRKITKFSATPLRVSSKSIQAAEQFLEKQAAGSMFAGSDIYASLEKILPEVSPQEEIHTAILLTDGNTLHNSPKQQHVLGKWLEKNSGKLSLYTAAVGQKNNLLMLDLLSNFSGGKLLYSDTHASFPRKLAKLVLDLKDPIAKDLMITALPEHSNAHIELHPSTTHLPCLYANQPYVIYGYIDNPCDFELILQGRHGEEWIAIKKSISFMNGEKGTRTLEKEWKAKQANRCYSKFLEEGKATYLKEAKSILEANRSEIAFK